MLTKSQFRRERIQFRASEYYLWLLGEIDRRMSKCISVALNGTDMMDVRAAQGGFKELSLFRSILTGDDVPDLTEAEEE